MGLGCAYRRGMAESQTNCEFRARGNGISTASVPSSMNSVAGSIVMTQRRNKKVLEEQYRPIGIKALSAAGQWQGTAENVDTEPEQDPPLEQEPPAERTEPNQTRRSGTQMNDFEEQSKRFAGKTAKIGQEAAAEAANGAEQATALMREVNVTLIDMAKANTEAMFDFAHRLATAQPSDLPQVWAQLGQKQLELMADQSRELTKLGQRVAGAGTEPFTLGLKNLGMRG